MARGEIQKIFDRDDANRQESLERARTCAALTKPWILPDAGWTEDNKLPETFSSLAARGITNLEGRLLIALFPPGIPFFRLQPASKFRFDPEVDTAMLQDFKNILHLQEMTILSQLERSDEPNKGASRRAGFRSRQRTALSQLLITGDVLTQLTDDLQIRVFRRDNYVTKRDSSGDIMYHVIREQIDPLSLSKSVVEKAKMDYEKLQKKQPADRMKELFTRVAWNPVSKSWVIEQELNGHIVVTQQEKITPFFSVPFELPPAANYGRGLIEQNLGDVRSINELTERLLDHAAIASKHIFALDYNSQVRPQDLARPTGSVIQARVQQGQVTDVGMLRADRMTDFSVAQTVRESIRRDLAVTMLMEGEATPTGERVTAYQVSRVAQELEGALGGVFSPIADAMQVPLVHRIRHVLINKGLIPRVPDDTIEIEAVTGVAALRGESDQAKLMQLLQTLAQLGPDTMGRMDMGVLMDLLVRQSGIYEPGLVKSDEQIQEEQQAAQQAMMQQQAAAQAIQSGGRIVESEAAAAQQREAQNV